jgi:hypothetical protein
MSIDLPKPIAPIFAAASWSENAAIFVGQAGETVAGRLTAVPCEAAQYGARNGARHLIELDRCCRQTGSTPRAWTRARAEPPE